MRTILIATTLLLSVCVDARSQTQPQLNLMPMPASVQQGTGQLPINQSFSIAVTGARDASLDGAVQRFETQLAKQTGIPFRPKPGATATLQIHADHGREAVQKLGEDESYELTVADSGAKLTAPTTLGVLRGLQTFLQ
ncbi:MAG TPA: beta-N-acetylhexosaminidase family protein, partial [Pyrinomonadaceae bacterium]|nr:beta-N-acetylhexosaminidase family protein [Pyrinomonadaceae bacterium]